MKKLLQPKVLIPLVLGVAILAALLAFGNISRVLSAMAGFNRLYILWVVLIFAGYTAVRGWQWLFLLNRLGIRTTVRGEVFAFLLSEATKSVPIGNYFQNYLLNRSEGADIGRTSAATTAMVVSEVAVSLTGIVVLGLGTWTEYLRILIIGGLIVFGVICWLFARLHSKSGPPKWVTEHKWTRKAYDELRELGQGAKDLLEWRTLPLVYLNTLVYLLLSGWAFYLVALGIGVHISYGAALAVHLFGLAVSLIFPLPVDFGVTEISGTGAFLLEGVSKAPAVTITLIYRIFSILTALLFAGLGSLVLREQLRQAMSNRASRQHATGGRRGASGGARKVSSSGTQQTGDASGSGHSSTNADQVEGERQATA